VISALPTEELKALFDKKLETSKDFKEPVEAIQSPEFAVNIQLLYHMCRNVNRFSACKINILMEEFLLYISLYHRIILIL
jgi:hypothetical protein